MVANQLFISFFLNKYRTNKHGESSISLRITINGQRESINTGINIDPNLWDCAKVKIRGKSELVNNQNNLLSSFKAKMTKIYADLINTGIPVTSAILKSKFNGTEDVTISLMEVVKLHNAYVKKKVGFEVVKATHVKYETLRKKLEVYIAREYNRNDLFLKELNQRFLLNFELFLKVEEKIAHNTTIKYVQFLKRIINYAIANEWIIYDPFIAFKCSFHPVNRECLAQEEIDTIHTKNFSTQRLTQVRDIFVFCCYTGLAYADVKKLNYNEIAKGADGNIWIQTFRAKTNTRVPVPLLPKALAILEAYNRGNNGPDSLVFPVLSNQKMNAYLKEIGDVCGITKRLTFHIARHTFATTITLSNGIPLETVSRMLGHTNIKTTQLYSKVLDLKISADMKQLLQKLSK